MPTTVDRLWAIPWACEYFLAQTVTDSELVIVGDGGDGQEIEAATIRHPRIRHVYLGDERMPLGQKYNACVEEARADIVALWADDDWHAPWRLHLETAALMASGREIAGLRQMLFHRMGTDRTWLYESPKPIEEPYFLGGSVCFRKSYFARHQFDPAAERRADASFTNSCHPEEYARVALVLSGYGWYLATIHDQNTGRSLADPFGPGWSRWHEGLGSLMPPQIASRYLRPRPRG